jgi:hypothetical protein
MQLDGPDALLHPDDHPSFKVCLEQILKAGSDNVGEFLCRCHQKPDQWLWMKIKLSVLEREEIGIPTLLIGTATDISADMVLKESLQRRVQLLELVLVTCVDF